MLPNVILILIWGKSPYSVKKCPIVKKPEGKCLKFFVFTYIINQLKKYM